MELVNCARCAMRRCTLSRQTSFTRHTTPPYLKRMKSGLAKEKPIQEYIGLHHKRAKRIYLWGNAQTGALGIPQFLVPTSDDRRPVLTQSKPCNLHWAIRHNFSVQHIAAGCGFSVFAGKTRANNMAVYGCGINTDSQIGFHSEQGNPVKRVLSPQSIGLPTNSLTDAKITSISCGRAHTVVATNKAVYTFGNNAYGQCGRSVLEGENYRGSRTIHTIELEDVTKVVCGFDHTLMLTADGRVFSCGLGTDGQTGLGEFVCTSKPTQVKGDIDGVTITDIDSKCDTVLAVSDEGELFGWGNSEYGQFDMVSDNSQISLPTHLPVSSTCGKVRKVASSGTNCALINEKGELYVWGYGILGKGPELEQSEVPQLVPMPLFGMTSFSKEVEVSEIFSGVSYLAVLTNAKVLYTWGRNSAGCLGLGHRNDQFFPFIVSIGSEVSDVACGVDHMITLCRAYV